MEKIKPEFQMYSTVDLEQSVSPHRVGQQGGADGQRPERRPGSIRERQGRLLEAERSKGGQEEGPAQESRGPERHAGGHQVPRLREGGPTRR